MELAYVEVFHQGKGILSNQTYWENRMIKLKVAESIDEFGVKHPRRTIQMFCCFFFKYNLIRHFQILVQ